MIPNYTLYGDEKDEIFPDILHCESIAARSAQHDWKIAPHRHHNLHQFFFLGVGGGDISIEGKWHNVKSPTVISMPQLTVHGFEFERNTEGWVVTIPDLILNEILLHAPDIRHSLRRPGLVCGNEILKTCFGQLASEHRSSKMGRNQLLLHMAGMLAVEIGRARTDIQPQSKAQESRKDLLVREFLRLLEENFRIKHSVNDYSVLLGVTPPHLTRTCQQVIGKSTSDLIQDRLILEAKRSLVYTRMPVSELAYGLGFVDPAHFSKFFHRRMNMSPSRFRERSDEKSIVRE